MILGRLAHARFGIPYVIDYIDPVVTEYYWKLPRSQRHAGIRQLATR
jgi:hypothetical protein